MPMEKEILVYDFISAISEAVDLVSPVLNSHHKKVAYISYRIAQEMELPVNEIHDIILAAMLHDIGAFSLGERLRTLSFNSLENEQNEHAMTGYKLLKNFPPLSRAASLIKHHHADFKTSKFNISMGSYIIHLADRTCILFDENREILTQVPHAIDIINQNLHKFPPVVIAAFKRLAKLEYFWIETFSSSYSSLILRKALHSMKIPDMKNLRCFAKAIAHIIDFRSRFTAAHSSGVAAVARDLAVISGYPEYECALMETAGYLHDFGKLAVSNEVLEKSATLNSEEFNTIRKHPYYTYALLSNIEGLEDFASWAAHHHERQDGNGFPFHVSGKSSSGPAHIMAVADVFTALTEDRPYRPAMNREKIVYTLYDMAGNGGIDRNITELASKNFFRINEVRFKAQFEALNEYEAFSPVTRRLTTENATPA